MTLRRNTDADQKAVTDAVAAKLSALPQADPANVNDWRCTYCCDEDVRWADEMIPSGMRRQVTCSNGHTTFGIPAARFTSKGGRR